MPMLSCTVHFNNALLQYALLRRLSKTEDSPSR
jgi:hypothetical protein